MSPALLSELSASARTSSATTAKAAPLSPARAASIAALSASRLVCSDRSATGLADLADIAGGRFQRADDVDRGKLPARIELDRRDRRIDLRARLLEGDLRRFPPAAATFGALAGFLESYAERGDRAQRFLRGACRLFRAAGNRSIDC
jgi:hypothetical protein